jgi:hypothetical protein
MRARAPGKRAHRLIESLALLLGLGMACCASAQNDVTVLPKGRSVATVALQNLFIDKHAGPEGQRADAGTITTNSAFLNYEYGLTDRLTLTLGLPYKSSKYVGMFGHNPATLLDDHGQHFIDDGKYHSGWQDISVSVRYAWIRKKWMVTPYLTYGTPLRDYVTFAHAAVGTGQWRWEAGVSAGRQFSGKLRNVYVVGGLSYTWLERTDRTVNHATLTGEVGYFFNEKWSAHANFARQKSFNGFDFPDDFPFPRNTDHFFYHDMNLRNDFLNVGLGVDWQATQDDRLFFSWGHTAHGDNTHIIRYVLTLGYSRAF